MANTSGNKSGKAEFARRVGVVSDMLLAGLKRRQIIGNIRKNENLQWDVTSKQIDNYIAAANAEILASFEPDKEELKKKIAAKYDFLYQRLIAVKDYKGAVTPLDKISELAGLKIQKTELTGKDGAAIPLAIQFIPYDSTDTDNP